MELSYDALNILLFLCPGLLTTAIIHSLVYRKEKDAFATIVSSLLWSLGIYWFCSFIGHDAAIQLTETKREDTILKGISYNPTAIFWLVGTAASVGLVVSIALTHDWIGKLLRYLRISTQSGRATIWLDVFAEYQKFVIVHLTDERRVFGWVLHYSNSGDDGYIYLHEPKWINENNEYVPTGSHGLFFVKAELIDFIEFLNLPNSTDITKAALNDSKPTSATATASATTVGS